MKSIECFLDRRPHTFTARPQLIEAIWQTLDLELSDFDPLEMESQPTAKALHSMSHPK
jgi:hypothetical protein